MPLHSFFPTRVYFGRLQSAGWQALNRRLQHESLQLREDDRGGREWSRTHYPGGYTSYGSLCRMHTLSPTFAALGRKLARHVQKFASALEFDLEGRDLSMTDCWVNIMPRNVSHSAHLHPLSTISGTYYVRTPKGSPGLKFEDPRLDRYMAAPPRKTRHRPENRSWATVAASAGNVVLFESWLRHEVPPNPVAAERISISFNFNWF
jgi:uncharacterized protein (TIGR02466 family)